jgi:neurotransmitter:Na+ symporter, NSS family
MRIKVKSDSWGSRVGLILAMAGNAVGLGNFLRFPVQAVQNGGGAFIIPYLVCFALMGIPLLWIEWSMGRYGGRFSNHSTPFILDNMTKRPFWKYFGVFGIFTNVAVAAYYCYIESWTMAYVYHSARNTFAGLSQIQVAEFFDNYVTIGSTTTGIPYEAVIFYLICLLLNTYFLSRGLSGGVEKVARIGIPMLLVFGAFLALRGLTLGRAVPADVCADCDAFLGLNFLWDPQFDSLANPNVWLAAAGQIFFTLSVGMGTIHCYAAYVRAKDDIALNAMSAGWMNGFVEIVLGASIVIPISVGYLGLDWVKENAGFAMAFQTMPYLFGQWGELLAAIAGVFWFGLLFLAGITSSLAMGTPWMGFMRDEFNWGKRKSAWSFGGIVLLMGLPTVLFFHRGVFDEYDYWAGTVSLVIFALAETIIFSWIFGVNKGWEELKSGADIRLPVVFKPVMQFVTPLLLLAVFLSALVTPLGNDWQKAFREEWKLDPNSIIGKIQNKGIVANRAYFSDYFETEVEGEVIAIEEVQKRRKVRRQVVIAKEETYYHDGYRVRRAPADESVLGELVTFDSLTVSRTYQFEPKVEIIVSEGDYVHIGDRIAQGEFVHNMFFTDMARLVLLLLFLLICYMVFRATVLRNRLEKEENNVN